LAIIEKNSPYIHSHRILFGDTDAAGIVYTSRFPDYCMQAAEHWFREYLEIDWYQINVTHGMGTPVVHMELDFISSLIGGDELGLEIIVAKYGKSTVTLQFAGFKLNENAGASACERTKSFTAKFVFCFFSKEIKGAIPIPQRQLKLLNQYIENCS